MSTVKANPALEKDPRIAAIFDDIRQTRNTDFVGNIWRYLAYDASLLESVWAEVKAVMATPSALDPKTKELIYIAVSIANNCSYCIHSHTAAAKGAGLSDTEYAELLKIVALAAKTNHLSTAMQIPVDDVFDQSS